ncbi:B9 domain-containing protein 2-like [Panonychus citri]|uniref:B9 domain-containing protein 2-like n=1 Tax=Panonychus citri TaxID=50023 RepID=UPI0023076E30|nr:B9 domain-containing protein 2-like [Panonychus citri]
MAEIHCFGSIIGTDDDFGGDTGLFAKWKITYGSNWQLIEGHSSGDTQVDFSSIDSRCYWSHPIDVHFVTNGIQNWPRIEFQVFKEDSFGRISFVSYGFLHLPSSPGYHRLKCYTWKPIGGITDRIHSFFTGSSLILRNSDIIYSNCDRFRVQTESKGTILLDLYLIIKNFDRFGVELS